MKEQKIIWYETVNGDVINNEDIERAFYVINGKYRWEAEGKYIKFLNSLFGKSISNVIDNITIEVLALFSKKVHAAKMYRDKYGCDLLEAKKAIDKMIDNMLEL